MRKYWPKMQAYVKYCQLLNKSPKVDPRKAFRWLLFWEKGIKQSLMLSNTIFSYYPNVIIALLYPNASIAKTTKY